MGVIIGIVVISLGIWLFKPDKKGDLYEKLGVSIYEMMLKKNPKTTEDEARAFVFHILGKKEYRTLTLNQLETIHRRITTYLSLHDIEMNQYEMRRIVECEMTREA